MIFPTSFMASLALTQRLANIWSIWEGSILMGHKSAWGRHSRSISSPIRRFNILSMLSITWLGLRIFGEIVCFRANASNCRVRSADRCAAFWISFKFEEHGWSGPISSIIISELPKIMLSILLKSWATPPAKRPTDSIFCAWRSWDSNLRFSFSVFLSSVTSFVRAIKWLSPSMSMGLAVKKESQMVPFFLRNWISKFSNSPFLSRVFVIFSLSSWFTYKLISRGVLPITSSLEKPVMEQKPLFTYWYRPSLTRVTVIESGIASNVVRYLCSLSFNAFSALVANKIKINRTDIRTIAIKKITYIAASNKEEATCFETVSKSLKWTIFQPDNSDTSLRIVLNFLPDRSMTVCRPVFLKPDQSQGPLPNCSDELILSITSPWSSHKVWSNMSESLDIKIMPFSSIMNTKSLYSACLGWYLSIISSSIASIFSLMTATPTIVPASSYTGLLK